MCMRDMYERELVGRERERERQREREREGGREGGREREREREKRWEAMLFNIAACYISVNSTQQ